MKQPATKRSWVPVIAVLVACGGLVALLASRLALGPKFVIVALLLFGLTLKEGWPPAPWRRLLWLACGACAVLALVFFVSGGGSTASAGVRQAARTGLIVLLVVSALGAAGWALGRAGQQARSHALEQANEVKADPFELLTGIMGQERASTVIAYSLARAQRREAWSSLNSDARAMAACVLARWDKWEAVYEALEDVDETDSLEAVQALSVVMRLGPKAFDRMTTVEALGRSGNPAAIEPLIQALQDVALVRGRAAEGLRSLGASEALPALRAARDNAMPTAYARENHWAGRIIGDPREYEETKQALGLIDRAVAELESRVSPATTA